jgi:hypothetical protein
MGRLVRKIYIRCHRVQTRRHPPYLTLTPPCRPQDLVHGIAAKTRHGHLMTTVTHGHETDQVMLVQEAAMTGIELIVGDTGIEIEAERGTADGAPGQEVEVELREVLLASVMTRGKTLDRLGLIYAVRVIVSCSGVHTLTHGAIDARKSQCVDVGVIIYLAFLLMCLSIFRHVLLQLGPMFFLFYIAPIATFPRLLFRCSRSTGGYLIITESRLLNCSSANCQH